MAAFSGPQASEARTIGEVERRMLCNCGAKSTPGSDQNEKLVPSRPNADIQKRLKHRARRHRRIRPKQGCVGLDADDDVLVAVALARLADRQRDAVSSTSGMMGNLTEIPE